MSASIATVVTMGFGSFGSVNLLPTLGYGIGVAVTTRPAFYIPHSTETADKVRSSAETADTHVGVIDDEVV